MRDSFLVDPLSLAEDCWVRDAMTVSRDDFGTAIDIVQAAAGGDDLVARLVAQHPIGSAHRIEHDERVLDVFPEVEAFAWGLTNRLGVPCFVPGEGFPDIATDCGWWIEAKAINRSAAEQAIRRRMVNAGGGIRGPRELKRGSEGLRRKLDSDLTRALHQWRHQDCGLLLVFFEVTGFDFGISPRQERVDDWLRAWGRGADRTPGVSLVLSRKYDWERPVYASNTL